MMEWNRMYRMQEANQPQDQGATMVREGFQGQGRGRGGDAGRGCGKVICYNCGEAGDFTRDCQN